MRSAATLIDARRTQTGTRPGEAPEPLGAPPARPRRGRRTPPSRAPRARSRSACRQRRVAAGVGRRAPRPDELGQDLPRARGPEGARPRRLRGAAAHARAGGAPAALGRARRGRRRPRHRRGARQRLRRRSSAAPSRWRRARARCSCSTRCSGPTTPSAARPGRASCSPATTATSSLLGALDAEPLVLHAFPEAEVKVFERILPLEFVGERSLRGLDAGHGRRRVQPQGGARARGRDQPAPPRPGLGALRRDAAQLAARGDRPVPQRRAPTSPSPPTCSGTASTCPARRCSSPRRRSSTASRGATCCRGSSRRSRAAPGASGSSSAGTSAC